MSYYHVWIKLHQEYGEFKVNLDNSGLTKRIVDPYLKGDPITIRGRIISHKDIERIRISSTEEDAKTLLSDAGLPDYDECVFNAGEDVTDDFIKGVSSVGGGEPTVPEEKKSQMVFVVHGRNIRLKDSIYEFLQAIGVHPMDFGEARAATGKASPYIGEVLDKAFSIAQAIVVLMTPDDEAILRDEFIQAADKAYERELTPQARPNVLFEAGMAMGIQPDRTVLIEVGELRPFSDIHGRHLVKLDDSDTKRKELADKLRTAGCEINCGPDWKTAGDFSVIPEDELFLIYAHKGILGRDPIRVELKKYLNQLRGEVISRDEILKTLVGSYECVKRIAPGIEGQNEEFVEGLYEQLLERAGESSEVSSWVKRLDDGASRIDVFNGFYDSPEFKHKLKK